MKGFFASLFAVLLLLVGVTLAAVGGMGLAIFGTDGTYVAPHTSVDSDGASVAIIADLASVDVDVPFHQLLGEVTFNVQSPQGGALFVGRAAQDQVDGYLFGQPYDLATRDDDWATVYVPGVETSVAPPGQQSFWNEQTAGSTASIALDAGAQDETLVLMNADGSAGVNVEFWLGFAGESIFVYSAAAIAAGMVLILLSVSLLVRRFRRKRGYAAPEADQPISTLDPDAEVKADAEHPAP